MLQWWADYLDANSNGMNGMYREKVKEYVENIRNQSIEKTKEQEEFLKQRISENNGSMSTIRYKITHYTTIIFAFASALVYLFTKHPLYTPQTL